MEVTSEAGGGEASQTHLLEPTLRRPGRRQHYPLRGESSYLLALLELEGSEDVRRWGGGGEPARQPHLDELPVCRLGIRELDPLRLQHRDPLVAPTLGGMWVSDAR